MDQAHSHTPGYPGRTHQQDGQATQAQHASLPTIYSTLPEDEADFKEQLTPCERIFYWACVGLAVGLSVALFFGTAGYLTVKACSL